MQLIINSNSKTSDEDMKDLRILLNHIKERFHFDWHWNTYTDKESLDGK